ncbi:hydroxysteroid dehydrogenase-like protein 2 [Anopheles darlingi]|uniref:hydroxysteroid dehydrogenase-like protein 2 n=1 Tax=Anopheles darlingi TaxID=43151 RepID=UPI002100413F|nr:hydroxysteroid dehydrogenase-like protein 2 [Anopheles darlingi]
MANASLILFVSLAVLTAAKPFNGLADTYERFVENSQPRGIQSRLPSEYQQLYDRIPEVYSRQQYPRVLYQPFARIPEELYNGDILQRQPTADREASILIHKERLQEEDVSPEEKNLAPEKPSLEDQLEKEAPNREQPEELAEEPQQRPDDEKEQPKDDKHEDNPEPEHKPQPKPNPKPEKPRKEGGRPHGKPEKKQGKGRPFGPRRPLKEPEQKDLAIDAKPSAANPKPDTPLVQINVQVASL